jgi:hypothetical protein
MNKLKLAVSGEKIPPACTVDTADATVSPGGELTSDVPYCRDSAK